MEMLNTIARRLALCLIMVPCVLVFMAFSLIFLAPIFVFVGWATGSRNALRDTWEMMITDGPMTMVADAWRGEA